MSDLRVLIVDDEPPARRKIRRLLNEAADVSIVDEATGGVEALERILATRPDVVLLDVEMPELDGFAVLRALPPDWTPEVVFVTAHQEFAHQAFDVDAVDYLVKPYAPERLAAALDRVRRRLAGGRSPARAAAVRRVARERGTSPDWIGFLVRQNDRRVPVPAGDIDWIEAAGNYLVLHGRDRRWLVRETLTRAEERLAPAGFVRIHRSTLVRLDRVCEIIETGNDHELVLRNGTRLRLSRRFRQGVLARFDPT
jgi:two-component system LytT family response regulator